MPDNLNQKQLIAIATGHKSERMVDVYDRSRNVVESTK